ncbi:hypothetical protein UT300012_23950 [Paraclostridium bifermentans]
MSSGKTIVEEKVITLECNKGEGEILGNLLRKYALNRLPSWRPIAFKLETDDSNILSAGDEIVESMVEFRQNLSELEFEVNAPEETDLTSIEVELNGRLMSDDLKSSGVTCKTLGVPLLTALNSRSTPVKIYLRKETGTSSSGDNLTFLQERGVYSDDSKITFIPSIHSLVTQFGFKVEQSNFDKEKLVLTMGNDFNSVNTVEVLKGVIERVEVSIATIKSQI